MKFTNEQLAGFIESRLKMVKRDLAELRGSGSPLIMYSQGAADAFEIVLDLLSSNWEIL